MKRAVSIFGFVTLAALATACGQDATSGVLTVHGTASQKLVLDNARAVAVGTDGRTFWAYLDQERDFTLRLPVGQSYRVLLANQLDGGGQRSLGYVTFPSDEGRSEWLGANEPGTLDLGRIGAATSAKATEGSVGTQCSNCGGDGDDEAEEEDDDRSSHDDDHECREKGKSKKAEKPSSKSCDSCDDDRDGDDDGAGSGDDDDDECDVCRDDDAPEKELRPSKQPDADKCKDKDKDKHKGKKDGYDDRKPCPKKSGGKADTGGRDAGADEGRGGGDAPSWPSDGERSEGSSGGEASSGGSSGGKPKGSSCQVTNHCSTECACVASRCEEN